MTGSLISYTKLEEKVKKAEQSVKIGGRYHHWKNREALYEVKTFGFLEWEDEVLVVIYHSVEHPAVEWVRPLEGKDGWLTPVEKSKYDKQRFILVSDEAAGVDFSCDRKPKEII